MVCGLLRGNGSGVHTVVIIMQEMDISAKKDFVEGEILAVDKPLGWTSFDVVKRLRGAVLRRLG